MCTMSYNDYWKNDEIYSKKEKEEWLEKIEIAYESLIEQITRLRVDVNIYPDQYRLEFVYLTMMGAAEGLQDAVKEGESYCKHCLKVYVSGKKCSFYDHKTNCQQADIPFEMAYKENGVDKFPPIVENIKNKRQARFERLRKKNSY